MMISLQELANRFGAKVIGDGDKLIAHVRSLKSADERAISFYSASAYKNELTDTRAGAVVLCPADRDAFNGNRLLADNPHLVFARIASFLHPSGEFEGGLHTSAIVADNCDIADSAFIGSGAIISENSKIGSNVYVGSGCYIGTHCEIGEHTYLHPNVTILDHCRLGNSCIVQSGSVIGSHGFGIIQDGGMWIRVPQIGGVIIGALTDIGANCSIDRGSLDDTVVGTGVKLDNLVHIAHNVAIGDHTVMAAGVAIAGSTRIGKHCQFAGYSSCVGHIEIADEVILLAHTCATHSIREKGVYSALIAARENSQWKKSHARLHRLDKQFQKIRDIEKQVKKFVGEQ